MPKMPKTHSLLRRRTSHASSLSSAALVSRPNSPAAPSPPAASPPGRKVSFEGCGGGAAAATGDVTSAFLAFSGGGGVGVGAHRPLHKAASATATTPPLRPAAAPPSLVSPCPSVDTDASAASAHPRKRSLHRLSPSVCLSAMAEGCETHNARQQHHQQQQRKPASFLKSRSPPSSHGWAAGEGGAAVEMYASPSTSSSSPAHEEDEDGGWGLFVDVIPAEEDEVRRPASCYGRHYYDGCFGGVKSPQSVLAFSPYARYSHSHQQQVHHPLRRRASSSFSASATRLERHRKFVLAAPASATSDAMMLGQCPFGMQRLRTATEEEDMTLRRVSAALCRMQV